MRHHQHVQMLRVEPAVTARTVVLVAIKTARHEISAPASNDMVRLSERLRSKLAQVVICVGGPANRAVVTEQVMLEVRTNASNMQIMRTRRLENIIFPCPQADATHGHTTKKTINSQICEHKRPLEYKLGQKWLRIGVCLEVPLKKHTFFASLVAISCETGSNPNEIINF